MRGALSEQVQAKKSGLRIWPYRLKGRPLRKGVSTFCKGKRMSSRRAGTGWKESQRSYPKELQVPYLSFSPTLSRRLKRVLHKAQVAFRKTPKGKKPNLCGLRFARSACLSTAPKRARAKGSARPKDRYTVLSAPLRTFLVSAKNRLVSFLLPRWFFLHDQVPSKQIEENCSSGQYRRLGHRRGSLPRHSFHSICINGFLDRCRSILVTR